MTLKPTGFRQEGNRWRLAFTLPVQREVMVVTDYEILAIDSTDCSHDYHCGFYDSHRKP